MQAFDEPLNVVDELLRVRFDIHLCTNDNEHAKYVSF